MGVEVIRNSPGNGTDYPREGDRVEINYHGTLTTADGAKFDSSWDRKSPFSCKIGVGQVIRGWDEGVPQLSLGEKATLVISPDYGYGAKGYPPVIPGNSTLVFKVHLRSINGKKATSENLASGEHPH